MRSRAFFNTWAVAVLLIGAARFLLAWHYGQEMTAPTAHLVAASLIACFIWLVGKAWSKPEFAQMPLTAWLVGFVIFALAFGLTVLAVRLLL